jgi:hypothetical protein
MFVTTTLGGLVMAISVGVAVGSVAGALVRPRLDRAHARLMEAAHRVLRHTRNETAESRRNPRAAP